MIRALTGTIMLASVLLPFGGPAHRMTEEGNRQYKEKEYDDALRAYTEAQVEKPESPELFYDIGNVLYRQGDFAGAEELSSRALRTAPESLGADTAFNLGNAFYRQKMLDEAVKAYVRALERDPGDEDAKRNLELTLRELKKQQQEQQGEPGEGDQEKKEDQQQKQEKSERKDGKSEEPQPSGKDEEQSGEDSKPEGSEGQEPVSRPGQMNKEDAERLLDGLADQEKENLRRAAILEGKRSGVEREEDW